MWVARLLAPMLLAAVWQGAESTVQGWVALLWVRLSVGEGLPEGLSLAATLLEEVSQAQESDLQEVLGWAAHQ